MPFFPQKQYLQEQLIGLEKSIVVRHLLARHNNVDSEKTSMSRIQYVHMNHFHYLPLPPKVWLSTGL